MYFCYPLQAIFCQKSIVKTSIKQKNILLFQLLTFFAIITKSVKIVLYFLNLYNKNKKSKLYCLPFIFK